MLVYDCCKQQLQYLTIRNLTFILLGEARQGTGSSSYIRWGRRVCPDTADLIYSGTLHFH